MPTSSTVKLPSKYQSGPRLFYRRGRPQSCKYDTYRTRARCSIVDETLFGDPLSKRIMERTRSLEAISRQDGDGGNVAGVGNPLKANGGLASSARPRTALATMRVSRDPEFTTPREDRYPGVQFSEPKSSKSNNNFIGSLVISSTEFRKMKEAAKEMTPEDRDLYITCRTEETRRPMSSPWAGGRTQVSPLPERVGSPPAPSSNSPRDGAALERAKRLREENLDEVRRLNELILAAKCSTILDNQVAEKEKRLVELAEADRHREEEMEQERKKAESMTASREKSIKKLYSDYKDELLKQLEAAEHERYVQKVKKEKEAEFMRREAELAREEDKKARERKLEKKVELQEQLRIENEEIKRRRMERAEALKAEQQRIAEVERLRREEEQKREEADKLAKLRREKELMLISQTQTKEKPVVTRSEELRLARQAEEKEREWREAQLNQTTRNKHLQEELVATRIEQMELKKMKEAAAMAEERKYWHQQNQRWRDEVEEERKRDEEKILFKKEYQQALQAQMERKEAENARIKEVEVKRREEEEEVRRREEETVEAVKQRKLEQLKTFNIPERYLREIERRSNAITQGKFTRVYHGNK